MGDRISRKNAAVIAPAKTGKAVRRVAAYCRVSTLQEEQELSYETQRVYYAQLIASDPTMTLVKLYGDQGGSGLTLKQRPEFQRMMRDCMEGKIDLILTKSISRFARNLADCVCCVRLLRERGIPVLFEKEGVDSGDPGSEFMLSVLASLAQEEARELSESIRWSLERQNASGNPSRAARYGYRKADNEESGKSWRICETEAKRVRLAFEMAARGERRRDILEALNRMENREGTGAEWSRERIYAMLTSEVYIGDILTNKSYTADYLTKKMHKNTGQRSQYYIEEHHEPIVDREIFERAGEWIRQRKPR